MYVAISTIRICPKYYPIAHIITHYDTHCAAYFANDPIIDLSLHSDVPILYNAHMTREARAMMTI